MSSAEFGSSILPEDFTPGPRSVIIGRGKKIAAHLGNQRFQEIIKQELAAYSDASSKSLKSSILSKVVDRVRRGCPATAFVKQDPETGRWYAVEDFAARITTAQAFRDSLHQSYRSSKKFKQQKRKVTMKKATSTQDLGMVRSLSKASSPRISQSDGALFRLKHKVSRVEQPGRNATWGQKPTVRDLDDNIFALLCERFSVSAERSDDPFEPTPVQEEPMPEASTVFGKFFDVEELPEAEALTSNVDFAFHPLCESPKQVDIPMAESKIVIEPSQ